MKSTSIKAIFVLFSIFVMGSVANVLANEIPVTPMPNMVHGDLKPVPRLSTIEMGTITWGGDAAAVLANQQGGIFGQHGLSVNLVHNDNLVQQTEAILAGKLHIARGTLGMLTMMDEALRAKGTHLVPLILITRSVEADAIVVRSRVKRLRDIRHAAVQFPGPHMYMIGKAIKDDGGNLSSVTFHWYPELLMSGDQDNPVDAFIQHSNLDAVTCIIPDANALVGMKEAIEGARIGMDTGIAKDVIFDLYAIRADVLEANKATIGKLAHALLQAQEQMYELYQNRTTKVTEYTQVTTATANMMDLASTDITDLLSGCEFKFHSGNVAFFTGKGTLRNLERVSAEIQQVFKPMGIVGSSWTMANPNWEWNTLSQGLKNTASTQVAAAPRPQTAESKKRQMARTQEITRRVAAVQVDEASLGEIDLEPNDWAEDGTLFEIEIFFDRGQKEFTVARYREEFMQAIEYAQAYEGVIVTIEGHTDFRGLVKARGKYDDRTPIGKQMLDRYRTGLMRLATQRAEAARSTFLGFARDQQLVLDESSFIAVGIGYKNPKYPKPNGPKQKAENRRVVFKLVMLDLEIE